MPTDPICKMDVNPAEAVTLEHTGRILHFCSKGCRDVFLKGQSGSGHREDHELIIVGGGPAGLTAAVYAATLRMDAFVITADLGGQAIDSTKIKNYMGYDFITGPELSRKFKEQLIHSNYIDHLMADVEMIYRTEDGFRVTVAGGREFTAPAIIVATGMTRRKLKVPGEEEFQRKGVFYGNVQDLTFVEDKEAAVIGGGNSAMQIVENLLGVASNIHLISDLPLNTAADAQEVERLHASDNVHLYEGCKVEEIAGDEKVEEIAIRELASSDEKRVLPVNGVFIAIGMHPNAAIAASLVDLNERGEIAIQPDCATSTPGLFAAGDVTDAYGKRIIIAAGEGAKAALAARQYLFSQKRRGTQ